ncbi:unnamed protein product [Amoebophrya sp. A25]|nr:unnamed protein product [Amoebophrya sp. A25]|eukprot:GSA25T00001020001.1
MALEEALQQVEQELQEKGLDGASARDHSAIAAQQHIRHTEELAAVLKREEPNKGSKTKTKDCGGFSSAPSKAAAAAAGSRAPAAPPGPDFNLNPDNLMAGFGDFIKDLESGKLGDSEEIKNMANMMQDPSFHDFLQHFGGLMQPPASGSTAASSSTSGKHGGPSPQVGKPKAKPAVKVKKEDVAAMDDDDILACVDASIRPKKKTTASGAAAVATADAKDKSSRTGQSADAKSDDKKESFSPSKDHNDGASSNKKNDDAASSEKSKPGYSAGNYNSYNSWPTYPDEVKPEAGLSAEEIAADEEATRALLKNVSKATAALSQPTVPEEVQPWRETDGLDPTLYHGMVDELKKMITGDPSLAESFETMLQQMLGKNVMHEAVFSVLLHLEPWLKENRESLSTTEVERYEKMLACYREVSVLYERQSRDAPSDLAAAEFKRIEELMTELQQYGELPPQVMNKIHEAGAAAMNKDFMKEMEKKNDGAAKPGMAGKPAGASQSSSSATTSSSSSSSNSSSSNGKIKTAGKHEDKTKYGFDKTTVNKSSSSTSGPSSGEQDQMMAMFQEALHAQGGMKDGLSAEEQKEFDTMMNTMLKELSGITPAAPPKTTPTTGSMTTGTSAASSSSTASKKRDDASTSSPSKADKSATSSTATGTSSPPTSSSSSVPAGKNVAGSAAPASSSSAPVQLPPTGGAARAGLDAGWDAFLQKIVADVDAQSDGNPLGDLAHLQNVFKREFGDTDPEVEKMIFGPSGLLGSVMTTTDANSSSPSSTAIKTGASSSSSGATTSPSARGKPGTDEKTINADRKEDDVKPIEKSQDKVENSKKLAPKSRSNKEPEKDAEGATDDGLDIPEDWRAPAGAPSSGSGNGQDCKMQ